MWLSNREPARCSVAPCDCVKVCGTIVGCRLLQGAEGRQSSSQTQSLNPPVCAQPLYTAVVSDTVAPGTFLLRVTAVDPSGGTVNYSIQDSAFKRFSINTVTGDITVSNTLQRKFTRSAVEIRVRATQTGGSRLVRAF